MEIHGTSRADMNGKRGVATDFHPMARQDHTTWRYSVKLDGGEAFKVKPANVRAEGAGGGGGGGGLPVWPGGEGKLHLRQIACCTPCMICLWIAREVNSGSGGCNMENKIS